MKIKKYIIFFVLAAGITGTTTCSTGNKAKENKLNKTKTIKMLDEHIPEWLPEKDFLVSDYVPEYCTSAVTDSNSLVCIAAFGSSISYLWHYKNGGFVQNGVQIPYNPVTGLISYNNQWLAVEYTQKGYQLLITNDSFTADRKISFPYKPIIGPLPCVHDQAPAVVWTEKDAGTSILISRVTNNHLEKPVKLYETANDIYELTAGANNANGYFAFTMGDEPTAYILNPHGVVNAVINKAFNLQLIASGKEILLSAVCENPHTQTSVLSVSHFENEHKWLTDTVVQLTGSTAIFSSKAIPWKDNTILYSIITKKPASFNNTGPLNQFVVTYNTQTKKVLIAGKITPPGMLNHNGYIQNDKLILFFAQEKIYLSVFSLNGLLP